MTSWPFTAPYGSFAESMALGGDGNLYVSLTTWGDETNSGRIVQVSPCGGQTPYGEEIDLGYYGLLTGVAFDDVGNLYVAEAFSDSPGVFMIPPAGPAVQVLALPEISFPNGVVFQDGYLYVTDSSLGAVWKADPTGFSTQLTPWLQDPLLEPGTGHPDHQIGANGLAFHDGDLYIAVADAGRLVRLPVSATGAPGAISVVLERPTLRSADGIAFDVADNLWLTTNGPGHGQLLVLSPSGKLKTIPVQPWLDYPTMPVFDGSGSLYVENGSFDAGSPSVVALP